MFYFILPTLMTYNFILMAAASNIEITKEVFLSILPEIPPHEHHVLRMLTHGSIPYCIKKALRKIIAGIQHFPDARSGLFPG